MAAEKAVLQGIVPNHRLAGRRPLPRAVERIASIGCQLAGAEGWRVFRRGGDVRLGGMVSKFLRNDPAYAHRYRLRDERGRTLLERSGISLFELSKFAAGAVETEEQRWLKFFKDGERLDADHLPDRMQTDEMRQAMNTVKRFSEKERAYDAYQARQNYLRMQGSIARHKQELEEALVQERAAREAAVRQMEAERLAKEAERQAREVERQAKEAERQAKEAERLAKEAERQAKEAECQAKEAALAEVARLQALLRASRPQGDV